jgi:hypothetical protein
MDAVPHTPKDTGDNPVVPEQDQHGTAGQETMDDFLNEKTSRSGWKNPLLVALVFILIIVTTIFIVDAIYPSEGLIVAPGNGAEDSTSLSTIIRL